MWFCVILAAIFPWTVVGLDLNVDFAIDYFRYRDVKTICVLDCNITFSGPIKLTKLASKYSIAVSEASIKSVGNDLSSVQKCLAYDIHSVGVLLNGNCNKAEDVMNFASEHLSFSAQHKWLIIENDDVIFGYNDSEINSTIIYGARNAIEVLNNLNISVDADVIVGRGKPGYYTLYDVFNFGKIQGGNLIVNQIGTWDLGVGLKLNCDLNGYKYYRRWDFQNWTMRMILVVSPALKNFDLKQLSKKDKMPGVPMITHTAGAILYLVAEMHNFSFTNTVADRWIGTFERSNGKVVGDGLYFREQDISPIIRFLIPIQQKIDVLSSPLTSIETRYYYRIPTKGPGKFENQFLMPLSPVAWYGVIGVSVLCALLLLLSAHLEQRPSSAQYAVFSVIASICQQYYEDSDDGGTKRISAARKVTILVTGLSCVLIYNYYTSSVVSWLLNGPPPSINSLKELLESPLELIYEDIGYTRSWLQTPSYYYNKRNALVEDELRQKKVFNKKKDDPLLEPLVQGIKMVQKGGYAYHTEVNSANSLISQTFDQTELCELGSLQSMEETHLYPCVPKNSPYKEFLSWSLMRLKERGFVSCIQSRTASNEVKCEGSSPRALALGGAAPAFILLAGGYLLATLIMLVERCVYKAKNNKFNIP
ncbi:ionotropic receptor 75a-like [Anticarsia gemmatalis]|uniref:ionotropic receptor 75a-like n=1 Tax=Anticarsia gemmatalis TaxID=129554 RepID=UPI003F76ADB7